MLSQTGRILGGYALRRPDLRLLYAAVLLSFLGTSIAFPLRMLYAQAHHATPPELGLMASVFLVGTVIAQLPAGWLVDRWGRVRVIVVGLIAHAIIAVLYIPLNSPAELIVLRFSEGLAIAGIRPGVAAYIADVTPEDHRGEAYGALAASLNVGMLLGPLLGGIIAQSSGFAAAFSVNFLIEALAIPLVIGRIHEPKRHRDEMSESSGSWRELFTLPLVGAYSSTMALQVAFAVLGALWAIWVRNLGGSYTYIGFTFSVFALPQIFMGATAGRLGDRFGRARFMLFSGAVAACIYVSYGFVTNLTLIVILGVVEGIAIVFQQPISQSLLADASPRDARGRVQGIAGMLSAIVGAVASFASLPLYHLARAIPFVGAGVTMVLGSSIAAFAIAIFTRRRVQDAQVRAPAPTGTDA